MGIKTNKTLMKRKISAHEDKELETIFKKNEKQNNEE